MPDFYRVLLGENDSLLSGLCFYVTVRETAKNSFFIFFHPDEFNCLFHGI